jgi:hypothetical protein
MGWRYSLHAGSERKDERNIPNLDENNEDTRQVADRAEKDKLHEAHSEVNLRRKRK